MGLLYRYKDAIYPTVEFEKENILFGISYDINVSKFMPASRLRGGAELSLRIRPKYDYLLKDKPKPPPSTRVQ